MSKLIPYVAVLLVLAGMAFVQDQDYRDYVYARQVVSGQR